MSTLKEILETKTTVSVHPKEWFLARTLRSAAVFSFLGLCIYVSQGSAWWTFVTGGMFLFLLSAKLQSFLKSNYTTFNDIDSAIEYLQKEKAKLSL